MIDINLIRENPQKVKEALAKKLWETDFTELLKWDAERKEKLTKNSVSRKIIFHKLEQNKIISR